MYKHITFLVMSQQQLESSTQSAIELKGHSAAFLTYVIMMDYQVNPDLYEGFEGQIATLLNKLNLATPEELLQHQVPSEVLIEGQETTQFVGAFAPAMIDELAQDYEFNLTRPQPGDRDQRVAAGLSLKRLKELFNPKLEGSPSPKQVLFLHLINQSSRNQITTQQSNIEYLPNLLEKMTEPQFIAEKLSVIQNKLKKTLIGTRDLRNRIEFYNELIEKQLTELNILALGQPSRLAEKYEAEFREAGIIRGDLVMLWRKCEEKLDTLTQIQNSLEDYYVAHPKRRPQPQS